MAVTMHTNVSTQDEVYSANPSWLPRRIPLWLAISKAAKLLRVRDYKALSERAAQLGVEKRIHPYDHRKRQLNMPQLLERLDFDIDAITFTVENTPKQEPSKPTIRKRQVKVGAMLGTSTTRYSG